MYFYKFLLIALTFAVPVTESEIQNLINIENDLIEHSKRMQLLDASILAFGIRQPQLDHRSIKDDAFYNLLDRGERREAPTRVIQPASALDPEISARRPATDYRNMQARFNSLMDAEMAAFDRKKAQGNLALIEGSDPAIVPIAASTLSSKHTPGHLSSFVDVGGPSRIVKIAPDVKMANSKKYFQSHFTIDTLGSVSSSLYPGSTLTHSDVAGSSIVILKKAINLDKLDASRSNEVGRRRIWK